MTNAQKTPFLRSQNIFAEKKIRDAIQLTGKDLPCSVVSVDGWIVTVKFELDPSVAFTLPQVTVPVDSSQYDYLPLQPGDTGVVVSADTRLGNVSGMGGGPPKLGLVANLSSLKFQPIGNKNFTPPDDPLMRVVQGPNGVIVQTLDGSTTVEVTADAITMTRGGSSVIVEDTGITLNGDVTINGKITSTDDASFNGGSQAVKLADGSNAVGVKGT